ncbi:MAG TPA: hypothetical protein VEW93_10790 [Acidimicrobiales bacterium]|nr:hypothetical protein [Acidimicrobiales bacterium]
MFTVHATKKLLERVGAAVEDPVDQPTNVLGNWYATSLPWKPQVALFVNEATLLPVLLPLAPARTVADRLPDALGRVLDALGTDARFVATEVAATTGPRYARTASRSVIGIMNEFTHFAAHRRSRLGVHDHVELAVYLAGIPCTPLYARHTSPDRELAALVATHLGP